MPVINLNWTKKISAAEKRNLIETIAETVSTAVQVSSEAINVLIHEIDEENVRFPEAVFTISWSKHPNRSREAKAEIIEKLTGIVQGISEIRPERIVVLFHDLDGENVGVAGKPR